jgi:HAD superfamily hydrolase (TIGR01509 family)
MEERNRRYRVALEGGPALCPFARETLETIGRRVPLALVTGSPRKNIETVHRSTGLLRLFAVVLCREDYDRAKPAPDSYATAAQRLGIGVERCLAVEDSERGLAAAVAAGMACVAVPGPLTRCQRFDGARAVLGALNELGRVLEC